MKKATDLGRPLGHTSGSIEVTGYQVETLRAAKWVAERVETVH